MFITDPEIEPAIENLKKAGRELRKWMPKMVECNQMLADYGMPQLYQGGVLPPFDVISHSVRDMKGTGYVAPAHHKA